MIQKFILLKLKKFITYLLSDLYRESITPSVPELSFKRSIESSCDYAEEKMQKSLMFFTHYELWDYTSRILNEEPSIDGAFLEFGVFKGESINYMSQRVPKKQFYGFDSFIGLKEDWIGWGLPKGYFSVNGKLPDVNNNVTLIKGWFDETLPHFLSSTNGISAVSFLHIDCDTYESTKIVLDLLEKMITKGTLILFDEYFGYRGWQIGEYLAFKEFVNKHNLSYEYLAYSKQQVLLRII